MDGDEDVVDGDEVVVDGDEDVVGADADADEATECTGKEDKEFIFTISTCKYLYSLMMYN